MMTGFETISVPRSYEYVAEEIRRQILMNVIPAGHPLPTQRELARIFGVGRRTIEQAVRVLEQEHLVESRRGRTGGRFVLGGTADTEGAEQILERVRANRDTIDTALSYRAAVEPAAAGLASVRRTVADLQRLVEIGRELAKMETDDDFMRVDSEFHVAVAAASRNPFLIEGVELSRRNLNAALMALPDSKIWQRRTIRDHAAILVDITAGDARKAEQSMRRHLVRTERSVRALMAVIFAADA
jgi:GntR family transcriptional repressor for pyruvate dehydrogenase complex